MSVFAVLSVVAAGMSQASRGHTSSCPCLLCCLGHFGTGTGVLSQKLELAFIWILPNLQGLVGFFKNQKLLLVCFVRKCGNTLLLYKTIGKARSLVKNYCCRCNFSHQVLWLSSITHRRHPSPLNPGICLVTSLIGEEIPSVPCFWESQWEVHQHNWSVKDNIDLWEERWRQDRNGKLEATSWHPGSQKYLLLALQGELKVRQLPEAGIQA